MMRLDTRLPADPASVAVARRFVREALSTLPADVVDHACLMVSELATNSVVHAGTEFGVAIVRSGRVVRVEVSDDTETLPRLRRPRLREPHGRGLRLVAGLSTTWGIEPTRRRGAGDGPTVRGKTLWFSMLLPAEGIRPERASA